jgi:glucose/arabinose dehydrogenase
LLDLPALPGPRYNGGPVAVGTDNNVYVIIGDVEGHRTKVQNFEDGLAADGTSGVLRIGKNGELPEPVIGSGTFGKYYFAYGIRNSFGLAFDPETDMLWDTENGPSAGAMRKARQTSLTLATLCCSTLAATTAIPSFHGQSRWARPHWRF